MDIYYKIVIGLLLIIVAVLFIRVMQYKRQMRIFADKLKARLDGGVDQDIHVEYFDRDILRLANALNDYSDQIKEKNLAVEKDRARLKNVIAGISHDFRTPLTAAKGYMQLMKRADMLQEKIRNIWILPLQRLIISGCFQMRSLRCRQRRRRMMR